MGFVDFFKKESRVVNSRYAQFKDWMLQSFSELKNDMANQRQWINYLHSLQEKLGKSHDEHKNVTRKDIDELKKWIVFLNNRMSTHEQYLQSLHKHLQVISEQYSKHYSGLHDKLIDENKMRSIVRGDVDGMIAEHQKKTQEHIDNIKNENEKTHEQLLKVAEKHEKTHEELKEVSLSHTNSIKSFEKANEELVKFREKHEDTLKKIESTRNELKKSHVDAINKLHERHKEELSKVKTIKPVIRPDGLTNPEQKLLNLLMAESDPTSYSAIAEKTGNSINTVRVIMNNLKKRGLVQENILPSGVKLFGATDKEKIKKLYNIEHL